MDKVRLAVIGLNFGKSHAANIKDGKVPGELAALADMKSEFGTLADTWKVPFFTDYKEMLSRINPEGVIIAVPPQFHKSIAIDCMEAGADVMVEKPVTLTSEEADELIAAEKRIGKKVLVGQHHRFEPTVIKTKEKITSGEFGRLIGFHIFGTLPKPKGYFVQDYKMKRALGGGIVANNGIHDVDRIRFLCGDVEKAYAMKGNTIRGFEVEDTAGVSIRCKSGVIGTYYISDCSHPLSGFTDTYFLEKGTIRFQCSSFYRQGEFHIYQEGGLGEGIGPFQYGPNQRTKDIRTIYIPFQNPHAKEVEYFCRMIREGLKPMTSAEDGKKSMELMNAVIESMDTGNVVCLK
ncbi:MAG: Gfo/Idh/MocA family oxidoreductase [Treponema sp.]|jgi:predicted dehydrogenase|nr:Gfo/Idh/MocA family oxidoreductase [Treponema sp.]